MLFSSMLFLWVFLPATMVLNYLCIRFAGIRASNALLLIASLLFYAWGEPVYILLMLLSIVLNWLSGLLLMRYERQKNIILAVCIIINLALLGYFKYFDMIIRGLNTLFRVQFTLKHIALPIGISFFTFQALSYVIDVYRGEQVQTNLFDLALYISFFPQLIAGPIVRYHDISTQITDRTLTPRQTAEGIRRFIYGLAKKILIANTLAECVDGIYALRAEDLSFSLVWIAAVMYMYQIYYDFSGYSDMAIGLGAMFGFTFRENFDYPYTSCSIREYWRRWHMSLGTWFREYVYIPLGGSRQGGAKTYRNLLIIFFLTGLWHGAAATFVIWGLYQGFFILLERLGMGRFLNRHRAAGWIYTTLVLLFGFVIFRSESMAYAFGVMKCMFRPSAMSAGGYLPAAFADHRAIFILICAVLGQGWLQRTSAPATEKLRQMKMGRAELIYCTALLGLCFASLASNTYNPFIYFRF